jgi:hypothetical protein
MARDILKQATALQRPKSRVEVSLHCGGEGEIAGALAMSSVTDIAQRVL